MKIGTRVRSLYHDTEGELGTVASEPRKASKYVGGLLYKVRFDKTSAGNKYRKERLYHEKFLEIVTPLEELL